MLRSYLLMVSTNHLTMTTLNYLKIHLLKENLVELTMILTLTYPSKNGKRMLEEGYMTHWMSFMLQEYLRKKENTSLAILKCSTSLLNLEIQVVALEIHLLRKLLKLTRLNKTWSFCNKLNSISSNYRFKSRKLKARKIIFLSNWSTSYLTRNWFKGIRKTKLKVTMMWRKL